MRIAIVHYGEHVPKEQGYRPVRYGILAQHLTSEGHDVTRISPSFAFAHQKQRPMTWSSSDSGEGRSVLIKVRAYRNSKSLDRYRSIQDLNSGVHNWFLKEPPFDVIVVGFPPPGIVKSIRRAVGNEIKIVADIRDLWPDALLPQALLGTPVEYFLKSIGKFIANELNHASSVTALSSTMLERAPNKKQRFHVPIGFNTQKNSCNAELFPTDKQPTKFVFVGSFAPLFDFSSFLGGWAQYQSNYTEADSAQLLIVGGGQLQPLVETNIRGIRNVAYLG